MSDIDIRSPNANVRDVISRESLLGLTYMSVLIGEIGVFLED